MVVPLSVITYKGRAKGMDHWLPGYVASAWARRGEGSATGPVHVMFLTADHFEPGNRAGLVPAWAERYVKLAAAHRDSDGRPPQHTWFYPADQFHRSEMAELARLCRAGYGEVELHLHHGYDTYDSLKDKLEKAERDFGAAGALTSDQPPGHAFAFIHGNLSLDNSRGDYFCGVDSEMTLLQEQGCFADFTFPSLERKSQPSMVNRIYYAVDDPSQPGSYLAGGAEMEVGKKHRGLLIFCGPLVIDFGDWCHIFYPAIDPADTEPTNLPTPHRVDRWVKAGVHVRGRPEWVFVKTWVHGAKRAAWPIVVGAEADRMFSYLESRYNDGRSYVLHYVTAREAYNIAKAAEAGKTGNPSQYRDYLVKPYLNCASHGEVSGALKDVEQASSPVRSRTANGARTQPRAAVPHRRCHSFASCSTIHELGG